MFGAKQARREEMHQFVHQQSGKQRRQQMQHENQEQSCRGKQPGNASHA